MKREVEVTFDRFRLFRKSLYAALNLRYSQFMLEFALLVTARIIISIEIFRWEVIFEGHEGIRSEQKAGVLIARFYWPIEAFSTTRILRKWGEVI